MTSAEPSTRLFLTTIHAKHFLNMLISTHLIISILLPNVGSHHPPIVTPCLQIGISAAPFLFYWSLFIGINNKPASMQTALLLEQLGCQY